MTASQTDRLPCRGCTHACPSYAHCDGKPWSRSVKNTQTSATTHAPTTPTTAASVSAKA